MAHGIFSDIGDRSRRPHILESSSPLHKSQSGSPYALLMVIAGSQLSSTSNVHNQLEDITCHILPQVRSQPHNTTPPKHELNPVSYTNRNACKAPHNIQLLRQFSGLS